MHEHVQRSTLPFSPQAVWDWHMRPASFERLAPPWQPVEIVRWSPIEKGARQQLRVKRGVWWGWQAQIAEVVDGEKFRDVQTSGPFAKWEHTHSFLPAGRGCALEDRIVFEVPFGPYADRIVGDVIARDVANAFAWRHARTLADLQRHAGHHKKRFAITGGSGFIGSELIRFLASGGHEVVKIVRRPVHNPTEIRWQYEREEVDAAKLEGIDVVVHLAGESMSQRWTAESRKKIRDSRVIGTEHLCKVLARLRRPPSVLVSGSAVGFYGDRGDTALDEQSSPGKGFLADTARAWEAATAPAREAGIRVVNLRTGIVLDPRGGAFLPVRMAANLGLSGKVGEGTQYVPWVALDDVIGLINHVVFDARIHGPVNATAPKPVTQARFAEILAEVMWRPQLVRVPAYEIEWLTGEQGREMLLFSQNVHPEKARASGFAFQYGDLESCLRALLGRPKGA